MANNTNTETMRDASETEIWAAAIPPGAIVEKEEPRNADAASAFVPGEQSGAEENSGDAAKILGANNEKLADVKPAVVAALRDLMLQFRAEGLVARRHEIRRIKQARLFWQGLQYAWWNPNDMSWHLPFESQITDDQTLQEMPRYQFVTNIYQAFGLSFVALLSQDTPATRFYPQSAQNEVDLAAAKAASDVAELVEQNNKVEQLLTGVAYYLWTDGKIGGYVRFVADGQRFGWHDEDVVEEVTIRLGEDEYACGGCGARTPAGKNTQIGEESGTPRNFLAGIMCPSCGSELMESDFSPAEMITIPRVVGSRRVPNGQEVITVIGGLELNTPVWANEMHEFPYLQWQQEVHSAKLRAAFPHVADKIEQGGPIEAEDVYARASRVAVAQGLPTTQPGDALYNLITFTRTWIRPWAFYAIEDLQVRA